MTNQEYIVLQCSERKNNLEISMTDLLLMLPLKLWEPWVKDPNRNKMSSGWHEDMSRVFARLSMPISNNL